MSNQRQAPFADGVFAVRYSDTGELQYFWQDDRPHVSPRPKPVRLPDDQETPAFAVALLVARREAGVPEFTGHKPRNGMGYVYFLACGDFVKIGFTRDPAQRLTNVRRMATADLDSYVVTRGPLSLEKKLHGLFVADRSNGEWFRRTPRLEAAMACAAVGKLDLDTL